MKRMHLPAGLALALLGAQATMPGLAGELLVGAIADPSGQRIYVAISGGNEIAVVDTPSWTVVERWSTGDEPDALGIVPRAPESPL